MGSFCHLERAQRWAFLFGGGSCFPPCSMPVAWKEPWFSILQDNDGAWVEMMTSVLGVSRQTQWHEHLKETFSVGSTILLSDDLGLLTHSLPDGRKGTTVEIFSDAVSPPL